SGSYFWSTDSEPGYNLIPILFGEGQQERARTSKGVVNRMTAVSMYTIDYACLHQCNWGAGPIWLLQQTSLSPNYWY
ncbi:hypothetical protein CDAR_170581, partial [Caerostris darwini]